MDLQKLLTEGGLAPLDYRVPSPAGLFTPIGVCLHHTASAIRQDPMPALWTVRYAPPAPRCNVLIGRDARVATITDGLAYDTGLGDADVLAAIRADDDDPPYPNDTKATRVGMTRWFYDIEIENNGVGEVATAAVNQVASRVTRLICNAHGWGKTRVITHRRITTRKIDPEWLTLAEWRALAFPLTQETDMAFGKNRLDEQKAMVRGWFRSYLNRRPNNQAELDAHIWALEVEGAEARVRVFDETAEGLARLNEERAQAGLPPVV